jgi:hypothetical protein
MVHLTGSCSCGKIEYKVEGKSLQTVACHCRLCRRMTGGPFSVYAVVKTDQFELISGAEELVSYQVTERTSRHFCKKCGTPIYNVNAFEYNGLSMLYFGAIKDHEQLKEPINIFCEARIPWVSISGNAKVFEGPPQSSGTTKDS